MQEIRRVVVHDTVDDAWLTMLRMLLERREIADTHNGATRELVGCTITLDAARVQFLLNPRRALSPIYASAELLWYLSGTRKGKMIQAYAAQYANYLDEKGEAHGAYGFRMRKMYGDLLSAMVNVIQTSPSTRQAVIPIFGPIDVLAIREGGCKDVPCTISWQFLMRDSLLHMICTMRSNDIWLGFPYDVYVNTTIHKMLAGALGVGVGLYKHDAGSMHLYSKHFDAAKDALQASRIGDLRDLQDIVDRYIVDNQDIARAVAFEAEVRTGGALHNSLPSLPQPLHDAVTCCTVRWGGAANVGKIKSKAIKYGMMQYLAKGKT